MNERPIYLDHQATTPADERVIEAMLPWFRGQVNAHSPHALGRAGADAVEQARAQVAELVNVERHEVVFTSGATEAAAIAVNALAKRGGRAVVSAVEHPCVHAAMRASPLIAETVVLPVDDGGLVDVDAAAEEIGRGAGMLAVMAVNNELGTIQPCDELGAVARFAGVPFLCDLTQAAGRIEVDAQAWNVSAGLLSAHKMHGPQGIGALVWRETDTPLPSPGGGQERGIRSGTLPVALCVGFGHACMLASREREAEVRRVEACSRRLFALLSERLPGLQLNGSADRRIPHNLNVYVPGIDADALCGAMADVAVSTGSACSSGAIGPSPVLSALGFDEARLNGSFRIGLGRATTLDEMDRAADAIVRAVGSLTGTKVRVG